MCIFCKIVNKEIPSFCIYEDELVMAFLDITQVTKGHTLVIPKQHCDHMLDCSDELLSHMMIVSKMLAKRIMDRCNASGMNILSNMNEVAGQSVPHFHIHLIPRYTKEDAIVIQFNKSKEQDLPTLCEHLK